MDSVRSRVANLTDFNKDITLESLKKSLFEAFEEVYNLKANVIEFEDLDQKDIEKRTAHFASWDVIFGKRIDFQHEVSKRFEWGQLLIQFNVDSGFIKDIAMFSDAMKTEFVPKLEQGLKNCKYSRREICSALEGVSLSDESEKAMKKDIILWFEELDL